MTENTFTTSDNLKIYTVNWLPQGEVRAVVLLVHGIGEHSRRYDHVAEALNQAGYAVYALDHRGHGQSEGERVYFTSFEVPVADLKQYFDQVRALHPDKKIFLYGHSMGSLISTLFALRYQDQIAGFISSGSPLKIDAAVPAPVSLLLRILGAVAPKLHLLPVDASTISRDPAVIAAYEADPLVNHKRVALGIIARLANAAISARGQIKTLRLPLLLLHGDADPLVPPVGSQYFYENASSQDKTLKMYPGLYHEVHNEPEQAQVLADVVGWLNTHA